MRMRTILPLISSHIHKKTITAMSTLATVFKICVTKRQLPQSHFVFFMRMDQFVGRLNSAISTIVVLC